MSDPNCIFCKIIEGKIPCKEVYSDSNILAFHDIHAQAPIHILIIPRKHISNINEAAVENPEVFQYLFKAAESISKKIGIASTGFRTVFNSGSHACQSVFHVHLHLLGGAQLGGSMVG